jgi:hypothetical protein
MWRWPIVVATCAVACRSRDNAPAAQPAASPPAPVVTPGSSPSTPAPRPALAATEDAGPEPVTPAQKFQAELVDPSWKAATETELRRKLARVHGGPPVLECRRATCAVTLTAGRDDLSAAMHDLEQLQPLAQSVLLTAPEVGKDGKVALRAYVRFDRPDP